ncbi:dipeptide ABC transporter ATP-binding protein [Bacillus sp. HMF5848]|uniref:ABC transporter ATP-binding protein n=1 Tax=Bacillus sp. HMF5848 TaxID=2495421 RepID=UPI000F78C33D|nr:dipeptide ABC transporter ATP-binding protein [Bacillus sp. HMF5848]RSK27181.1 dipeptide ABC transporter ATP-binding protein [Bacillus sp. HMF5848]
MQDNILEVNHLKVHFPIRSGLLQRVTSHVRAVDGISFHVYKGETLGIVGESGCGKSTTGRAILQLVQPTSGEVIFEGVDFTKLSKADMRKQRPNVQMVFQDPYASLNPRLKVEQILSEPITTHLSVSKTERRDMIASIMELCGLNKDYMKRYAHEFSGGQRQRIGIARALILKPKMIIADEAVSALDVSIQSQILNLMQMLQKDMQLTYIFISHDLSVVRHISDRVAVMYLGRIVELADTEQLYDNPKHPYTQTLLSAIPVSNPRDRKERIILQGDVPSPSDPPKGCAFASRCPKVMDICHRVPPKLERNNGSQFVACHLYKESYHADQSTHSFV